MLSAQIELLSMISGHEIQGGLRKMLSGVSNDKVSEKEGTLEIRKGNFLIVHLGRPRPRERQGPASTTHQEDGRGGT